MKRSPAVAVWLSLLPGLGHIYVGQSLANPETRKAYISHGFAYALMTVGLIYLTGEADGPIGILIPIFWVFVMLDAHRGAMEANRGIESMATGEESASPKAAHGTPWLGWIAIGLGALLLLNSLFNFDFDWLWRFWPLALIAIGVKLIKNGSHSKGKPVIPPAPSATPAMDVARNERDGDERSADG